MNAKILLVDDDPSLLKLLRLRLQSIGYDVVCASSGQEALGQLENNIDIVLTDLKMDGMNGIELFQQIRKQQPTLPVVIMTAHGSIPEAVSATREGVFSFLTKPIDKELLTQTLADALASNGYSVDASWKEGIITRCKKNGTDYRASRKTSSISGQYFNYRRKRHRQRATGARYS